MRCPIEFGFVFFVGGGGLNYVTPLHDNELALLHIRVRGIARRTGKLSERRRGEWERCRKLGFDNARPELGIPINPRQIDFEITRRPRFEPRPRECGG